MIQRIQTIYLLVAFISMLLIFLFPFAHIMTIDGELLLFKYRGIDATEIPPGIMNPNAWFLSVLCGLILVISFVSMLMYKNRTKQIRLSMFNMLLMIGLGFLVWFYLSNFATAVNGTIYYKFPIILPAIAIILTFLAYKAIKKDEKLVRSVDRIR